MITRIALSTSLGIAAGAALADPPFIESPLPPAVAEPAPPPAPAPAPTKEEIERAAREAREKRELGQGEKRSSPSEIDAYRAREHRDLDVDEAAKPAPRGDAERVRGDIDRARERIDVDRRIDRTATPKP